MHVALRVKFRNLGTALQVNDGQLDRKKKLFVGMAPKAAYESDYRPVFAPFGNLVDIYVIRDRNGFSKGCAFVKYDSAQSARDAIDALHDKYIMPGGFRTLVVAIADDRRSPSSSSGAISGASAWQSNDNIGGDGCLESCRAIRRRSPRPGGTNNAALCSGGGGCLGAVEYWPHGHISSPPSQQQQQQQITTPQAGFASPAAVPPPSIAPSSTMMPGVPYYFGGVGCGAAPQGTYIYYPHGLPMTSAASSSLSPCQQQMTPGMSKVAGTATANPPRRNVLMTPPCEFDASAAGWHDNFRMAHRPLSSTAMGFPQQQVHHQCDEPRGEHHHHLYGGFFEGSNRGVARMGNPEEEGRRWAKQPVGPSGANLFVYYLPGSLTDADLATAFAPFGEVLSAKVYYDRDTGESKGFGERTMGKELSWSNVGVGVCVVIYVAAVVLAVSDHSVCFATVYAGEYPISCAHHC